MNTNYTPQPWHLILSLPPFALGTYVILKFNNWEWFAAMCWVIGIIIVVVVTWALLWDVFSKKADALRYLMDSARHLNDDVIDRLLYAMGLHVKERTPSTNLSVTIREPNGAMSRKRHLHDVPASPDQLLKLADGLINQGAPFSRNEWTASRGVFSDTGFRTLKEYLLREKLIEPKNAANLNEGYRLTTGHEGGYELLKAYLPSPTPPEEVPQNQVM